MPACCFDGVWPPRGVSTKPILSNIAHSQGDYIYLMKTNAGLWLQSCESLYSISYTTHVRTQSTMVQYLERKVKVMDMITPRAPRCSG